MNPDNTVAEILYKHIQKVESTDHIVTVVAAQRLASELADLLNESGYYLVKGPDYVAPCCQRLMEGRIVCTVPLHQECPKCERRWVWNQGTWTAQSKAPVETPSDLSDCCNATISYAMGNEWCNKCFSDCMRYEDEEENND